MHITQKHHFPVDPTALHAALTDESFLRHAASGMGAPDARVAATPGRTAVEAAVEAPPAVRPFVGDRLRVVQEMTWADAAPDGTRDGTVAITVPGAPVTLEGTARIEPAPGGSALSYEGDLVVRIPVMGGRIEREVAPALLDALDQQAVIGREWLQR